VNEDKRGDEEANERKVVNDHEKESEREEVNKHEVANEHDDDEASEYEVVNIHEEERERNGDTGRNNSRWCGPNLSPGDRESL